MTKNINTQLKAFILSELREKGHNELYEIILNANIIFNEQLTMLTMSPTCAILIANKVHCKLLQGNSNSIKILKKIIGFAMDCREAYGDDYHLELNIGFDLKNWEDINIANINENVGDLEGLKQKMIERYVGADFEGCLTSAKSLIEAAFKRYLIHHNIEFNDKVDDFPKLQKAVIGDIEKNKSPHYQRVINGMKGICMGINETRNEESDSHGKVDGEPNIDPGIVKVIVETSISITHFIVAHC